MPLMEPRSPWASTHGEKATIPNIRIDLAEFGIGKLLSCGRLTANTSANCPVTSPLGTNLYAAPAASQVERMHVPSSARSALRGIPQPNSSKSAGLDPDPTLCSIAKIGPERRDIALRETRSCLAAMDGG